MHSPILHIVGERRGQEANNPTTKRGEKKARKTQHTIKRGGTKKLAKKNAEAGELKKKHTRREKNGGKRKRAKLAFQSALFSPFLILVIPKSILLNIEKEVDERRRKDVTTSCTTG